MLIAPAASTPANLYRPVFCLTFPVGPVQRDNYPGRVNLRGGHAHKQTDTLLKKKHESLLFEVFLVTLTEKKNFEDAVNNQTYLPNTRCS